MTSPATPPSRPPTRAARLLAGAATLAARWLLVLYPPAFRREAGAQMREDFRLRALHLVRERGVAEAVLRLAKGCASLLGNAPGAWRDARREGDVRAAVGGRVRDHAPGSWDRLHGAVTEVCLSVRRLARAPAFTLLAVLTLTLGVGANTAVFSVLNSVLLEPLAYPDPDRLISLRIRSLQEDFTYPLSVADFEAWREGAERFEAVGAYYFPPAGVTVQTGAAPEAVAAMLITPGLFDVLGVLPDRGRGFRDDEAVPGGQPVAVVSDAFWRTHMGAPTDLGDRPVSTDGEPVTVVGVMPPGFRVEGEPPVDVWLPLREETPGRRGPYFLTGLGRLAEDVSLDDAREGLARVAARLDERFPPEQPGQWGFVAEPLKEDLVEDARATLVLLLAGVTLVLVVAVGNTANLFLARAAARGQETTIKQALGAGRGRLTRESLADSMLVSGTGSLLGVLLAWWCVPLIGRAAADFLPRAHEVGVDARVLAVACAIALGAGLALGLAPAAQPSAGGVTRGLHVGGRGAHGPRVARVRRWLVGSELALAFVVLIAASLLVHSLHHLRTTDAGVDPDGVLTARISLPESEYPEPADWAVFFRELLRRVEAISGVERVAVASSLPPDRMLFENDIAPADHPEGRPTPIVHQALVSESYFDALGIRLLQGRAFETTDDTASLPVIVVGRSFAERFWPGQDPVGQRLTRGTVVGVVEDVKYEGLERAASESFYTPYFQSLFFRSLHLAVKGSGEADELAALVRRELATLDPSLVLRDVSTLDRMFQDAAATPRFRTLLFSVFGLLALFLAMAGVYGVLAFMVSERRREMGVRIALGAPASGVVRLVVADGLKLVLAGLAVGMGLALLGARYLSGMLYQVSALDPLTWGAAAALLLVVGAVASATPAIRAARQDPNISLRGD